jgi:hypothetical protein
LTYLRVIIDHQYARTIGGADGPLLPLIHGGLASQARRSRSPAAFSDSGVSAVD